MLPRKVALHTSSHLTPIEAWRSAVSTTSEGRRVLSEVWLENCTHVWGWAKFGQRATHHWGKIALHTFSGLSKLVGTCLNQSAIQWPCTPVVQCHFLHFGMLLFFGLTSYPGEIVNFNSPNRELSNGPVYGLWRCIEVKLSIPLGAHALRRSIERASSAVSF